MTRSGCSPRRRCWSTGMPRRLSESRCPTAGATNISRSGETLLPQAALPDDTLVLRDYHVDNLMLLPDRSGVQGCGLLDFQDAVCGPPSYDLVSLLEDARRDVPAELRRRDDRALSRCFSGARPGGVPALGGDPRGSAQLQDPRHLHAAVEARRQARATSSTSRGSGGCSKKTSPTRPSTRSREWLDRHLPRAARHARSASAA